MFRVTVSVTMSLVGRDGKLGIGDRAWTGRRETHTAGVMHMDRRVCP